MPRYTICPYYIDESRKTISCEDVCRSYDSMKKKWAWMDMYCDSWDWMKCPYAADRAEAYRRYEEGDVMALEKQETDALKKEIESLLRKLGRANKRIERQQKKIDELRAVNKSFVTLNNNLEKQKKTFYTKWREAQAEIEKGNEKIQNELSVLGNIYEQRMCYLINAYAPNKILYEEDINAWAADKEFALVHEYIDVNDTDKRRTGLAWKVVFKDDETKTDED